MHSHAAVDGTRHSPNGIELTELSTPVDYRKSPTLQHTNTRVQRSHLKDVPKKPLSK